MNIVTGAAGFIGSHLCQVLLNRGFEVVGVDNINDYYDPRLKLARLERLRRNRGFLFQTLDIADSAAVSQLFSKFRNATVYHLAAQAGVRHSIYKPMDYASSNLVGFLNILEGCRHGECQHLVYASSSSVYGLNRVPFRVEDGVDHPVSLYAATKKSNELMAHSYSHLYGIPTTGLRFFTVYGPWGRPDMAAWLFASAILEGRPIKLFNHGKMRRDFTFIDDVIDGILRAGNRPPSPEPSWDPVSGNPSMSSAPWRIYNIGNRTPEELGRFVQILEDALGREAIKEYVPMQYGDVAETCADLGGMADELGFSPTTPLEVGLPKFANWLRDWTQHG